MCIARAKTVRSRQKVSTGIVHSQSNDRAQPAERPRKAGKKSCEQQLKSREQQ